MASGTFDIGVIGGGMAGLSAAYHAAVAGCSVGLFAEQFALGGLVANVGAIDGFPSISSLSGIDLALATLKASDGLDFRHIDARIEMVEPRNGSFVLKNWSGVWQARKVVVATGAKLRMPDVPGMRRLIDRGVLQCAWCNGGLFRGKRVVVLGSGDSALQEALHLANLAASVTLLIRGTELKARQSYIDKAADNSKIEFRWECDVEEVLGESEVTAVRIKDRATGVGENLACDGVFVYVGLQPNGDLLGNHVERDERLGVITNASFETRTKGMFAVGALRSGYSGRIAAAVGEGATAAVAAAALCRSA